MAKRRKKYLIILIIVLICCIIGSTYAYLTATIQSSNNSIQASSKSYGLNLEILPFYSGFRLIPMNDSDALVALKNNCKDDHDRGACSAYKINLSDYDPELNPLSGIMNVDLTNISNLSYMFLEEKEELVNEDTCLTIDNKIYCITKNATPAREEEDLDLGTYNISNTTEKHFLLVIWLTNIAESQDSYDSGDYNATVTFTLGEEGKITGNITASIGKENELQSKSGE